MIKSPIKTHGGKSYLLKWLQSLMPAHGHLIDAFGGSGIVALNSSAEHITYCDLDPARCAVMCALRTRKYEEDLKDVGEPCERTFLEMLRRLDRNPCDPVAYTCVNRWSRGGMCKDYSQSTRTRGNQDETVNCWENMLADLPRAREKANRMQVLCANAIDLLRGESWKPGTFFYLDPTYMPETRTAKRAYAYEMTEEDHIDMLMAADNTPCDVMISGYTCPLYNTMLSSWSRIDKEMPNHSGQGVVKQRRIESVWLSY